MDRIKYLIMTVIRIPNQLPNGTYAIIHLSERPYLNLIKNMKTKGLLIATYCTCNMRQAQHIWRTKSYSFKRRAWEGNVLFFFRYFLKFFLIIWLELSLFDLWLFRSFYLRRSSAENLVERNGNFSLKYICFAFLNINWSIFNTSGENIFAYE
jgi:hypothetical protein